MAADTDSQIILNQLWMLANRIGMSFLDQHLATVSSKNQITLPKKFIRSLGLKPKRRVEIELYPHYLLIKPAAATTKQLFGVIGKKIIKSDEEKNFN